MTREELIARIEAGETGCWIDMEVARATGLHAFLEGGEAVYVKEKPGIERQTLHAVRPYTTSLDAAVSLVGGAGWAVDYIGNATIITGASVYVASVSGNPAAALVAAWLKATA